MLYHSHICFADTPPCHEHSTINVPNGACNVVSMLQGPITIGLASSSNCKMSLELQNRKLLCDTLIYFVMCIISTLLDIFVKKWIIIIIFGVKIIIGPSSCEWNHFSLLLIRGWGKNVWVQWKMTVKMETNTKPFNVLQNLVQELICNIKRIKKKSRLWN